MNAIGLSTSYNIMRAVRPIIIILIVIQLNVSCVVLLLAHHYKFDVVISLIGILLGTTLGVVGFGARDKSQIKNIIVRDNMCFNDGYYGFKAFQCSSIFILIISIAKIVFDSLSLSV